MDEDEGSALTFKPKSVNHYKCCLLCCLLKCFKSIFVKRCAPRQGSKIALLCSYLRVPQAAGQVKILIFLVKTFFPMYANIFCDAGQVPILRYFQACQIRLFLQEQSDLGQYCLPQ